MAKGFVRASHPWQEPLRFASRHIGTAPCALLYSGMRPPWSGRYSYLALQAREQVAANDFTDFAIKLSANQSDFDNTWFGYLGYELAHELERFPDTNPSFIPLPRLFMASYDRVFIFDHEQQALISWSHPDAAPLKESSVPASASWRIAELASNMSKVQYLAHVAAIKRALTEGDLYQANLTRKFYGTFDAAPDSFSLFESLCRASPAPYSAYLQTGDTAILSSSPERFLRVAADGSAESRPIKGTAPRHADAGEDDRARARLQLSEKDRAENLMIVDLMRNDLSRACVPGSVQAKNLFQVSSYATLHHLDSTIVGQKRADVSTLDLVKDCFPPGSMTGAPKISAMRLCAQLETMDRGVYSGALGWFGGDGSCDLSVVIRTLILRGDRFEFQVGGGIVADSEPHAEWQETLVKARGIATALGIASDRLETL